MYSLAIYLYMLCARVAALFNKKAKLLVRGHSDAWRILREQIGDERYVWFHAASLGEFEQGRPLMERLRKEHPEKKILLTFFSPSGYEVRKHYEGADVVCYLPFDTPLNARKFVRLAKPEAAFFIKYEFWRNYIEVLNHRGIPTYSVSSIFREEQIFFKWYGRNYARCLKRFTHFFVQNEHSKLLLEGIGVNRVTVTGDTRFDRVLDIRNAAKDIPLVEAFAKNAGNVLVAGSSWQPDEDIIIPHFNADAGQKLVLAPHVISEDHLREIETKLCRPFKRLSQVKTAEEAAATDCLIIDCFGLLSSIYRYATVAYVGGGFGVGIHNVPEAAVYGVPVIIGPNNHRFREARALIANGGCIEIHNSTDYENALARFAEHPSTLKVAGSAAGNYIASNAGAADRIFKEIYG